MRNYWRILSIVLIVLIVLGLVLAMGFKWLQTRRAVPADYSSTGRRRH